MSRVVTGASVLETSNSNLNWFQRAHISIRHFLDNKWVKLVIFSWACFTTSCLYYGWQAYSDMLYKSGAYAWLCDDGWSYEQSGPCQAQTKKVDVLYSIGAGCEYSFAVVAGVLLDHLGPRYTAMIGELTFLCGTLLMIFSSESFNAYIPALILTGASVNLSAFPSLILGEIFPKFAALAVSVVLATQTGATLIAPVLSSVWDKLPGTSFKALWLGYLGVIWLPIFIVYSAALPRKKEFLRQKQEARYQLFLDNQKKTEQQNGIAADHASSSTSRSGRLDKKDLDVIETQNGEVYVAVQTNDDSDVENVVVVENTILNTTSSVLSIGAIMRMEDEQTSSWSDFFNNLFTVEILLAGIYVMLLLWMYAYYPTVIREAIGEDVSTYLGWAMPTEAIWALIFGYLIDLFGTVTFMFVLIVILAFVYACAMIKNTALQYICASVFVLGQSTIFTPKYTLVQEMFDSHHYGKLVGCLGFLGGMATLLNIPVGATTDYSFWFKLDAGLCIPLAIICVYIGYRQIIQMKTHRTVPMKNAPMTLRKTNEMLERNMEARLIEARAEHKRGKMEAIEIVEGETSSMIINRQAE